jgi:hypothetical protein
MGFGDTQVSQPYTDGNTESDIACQVQWQTRNFSNPTPARPAGVFVFRNHHRNHIIW